MVGPGLPSSGERNVRTTTEKLAAADAIARRLEKEGPRVWRDAAELRAVADAFRASIDAEHRLVEAVKAARDADVSWGAIGDVLGVSRQAAQHRFGDE